MRKRSQSGFTLVELLVVIAILALLAGGAFYGLPKLMRSSEERALQTWMMNIGASIKAYSNKHRDFPPSQLAPEAVPGLGENRNRMNTGIESVVVCLTRKGNNPFDLGLQKGRIELDNLDADESEGEISTAVEGSKELYELIDPWGTPFAYFHHRDYADADRKELGRISHPDDPEDSLLAEPQRDPKTKAFYNPKTYQLISAGPDREFGTDDDIANFDL
jgi:prepilin-type N-terminal cleavage/methylation domain-containing protein